MKTTGFSNSVDLFWSMNSSEMKDEIISEFKKLVTADVILFIRNANIEPKLGRYGAFCVHEAKTWWHLGFIVRFFVFPRGK